jgi:O-antigen/teichoic acid export membrane protein
VKLAGPDRAHVDDAPAPAVPAAPRIARDVIHGSGASLLFSIGGHAVTLAAQVLLARWLTRDGYGTFAFALAVLTSAAIVAQVGLPRTVVRFTAAARVAGEWGRLRDTARLSAQLVLGASVLISALGAVAIFALGDQLTGATRLALGVALVVLPLQAVGAIQAQMLLGLRKILAFQILDKLVTPVGMLCGAGALFLAGVHGVGWAMSLRLMTAAAIVACSGVLVARTLRRSRADGGRMTTRELAHVALPMFAAVPLHAIMNRADVFMLGSMATMGDVALYDAAERVANVAMLGLLAANTIMSPLVAEHFVARRREALQSVLFAGALFATAFTVAIALVVTVGESLILGVFGPEYLATAPVMRLLLVSQIFNSLMGPVAMVLTMTDHQRQYLLIIAVSAAVNVGINLVLIPAWGATGAAAAHLVTTVLRNVWMSLLIMSSLGVNATAFSPAVFRDGRAAIGTLLARASRKVRR